MSRGTHRIYTHVVALVKADNTVSALAWCGSLTLARGQQRYWSGERLKWKSDAVIGARVEIFPVDAPAQEVAR